MELKKLNLSERELRAMAIVFVSAMEHDWNDWSDGPDGMTGENQKYLNNLANRLGFVFNNLGEEGLKNLKLNVADRINSENEAKYGKVKECCHMYPKFCRCDML